MTCELINGAIFLHIPKTGGCWVHEMLRAHGLVREPVGRHPHAGYERAVFYPHGKRRWKEWSRGENWKPDHWLHPGRQMKLPPAFCFVRHPVTWYESWWRYLWRPEERIPWMEAGINQDRRIKQWNPLSIALECMCDDFGTFMSRLLQRMPGFVTWMYGHYAVPNIEFVGKQEHLAEDLITVLRRFGLAFDESPFRTAKRVNQTHFKGRPIRWDPGLLREVQAAENSTLVRFGYEVIGAEELAAV